MQFLLPAALIMNLNVKICHCLWVIKYAFNWQSYFN